MRQEQGVVLRSFLPYKRKLSVLTANMGKIVIVVKNRRITSHFSPGTCISFFPHTRLSASFVGAFEVIRVPVDSIKRNVYWVHHVLEVCYYFAPLGMPCTDLYTVVQCCIALGRGSDVPHLAVVKKVCLVRLWIALGFFPDVACVRYVASLFEEVVTQLGIITLSDVTTSSDMAISVDVTISVDMTISLDSLNAQKVRLLRTLLTGVDCDMLKKVDAWLFRCMQEHPHVEQFKTLSFFEKL